MARIAIINDPYNPHNDLQIEDVGECSLLDAGKDFLDLPWIAIAYIDGERYYPLREEWADIQLSDDDIVYFMPHVGGVVTGIIIAVVAIAAIAVALLTRVQPPNLSDTPEADPVFDLRGQRNQVKLGQVIEDCYGRNRIWPSYATRSYSQYYGNDEFQYQLLCLGQGSFEIEKIMIEDTDIENFQDVEIEITEPGEQVTLFPDNVITSVEVGSIELFATNQDEFIGGDDMAGPFSANTENTETNRLEVDIILPQGLYRSADNGSFQNQTVTALFEYREINTAGEPIGTWQTLTNFSRTLATNTPQRYTITANVPKGRYEVQAKRTNEAGESNRSVSRLLWNGLRAFLPPIREYGDVTLLAMRARASNSLNDQSSNRLNVIATRKIPIYENGTIADLDNYSARVATRSPIWAMVNQLRARYGGMLQNKFIDFDQLVIEAEQAEQNGIYFDWIYDQSSTVWEAIKLPAYVNKAIPMLNGSRVTTIRDRANLLPSFFISDENTLNDFAMSKKLFDITENDGLLVEYTDPDTFTAETVPCVLPGEIGNNLRRLKIDGVTDRQRAFELGMYAWSKESFERTTIELSTGLEGYIPTYGDLVKVQSDVPNWGISGIIESIEGNTITVFEDLELEENQVYKFATRTAEGGVQGPFDVTLGANKNQLISSTPIPIYPQTTITHDLDNQGVYMLGNLETVGRICRIVDIRPSSDEEVNMTLVINDERRFQDYGQAPTLTQQDIAPQLPNLPIVNGLDVQQVPDDNSRAVVSWNPALGAVNYILEISTDNINFNQVANTSLTSHTITVINSIYYIRVAGVGFGVGPFDFWQGQLGIAINPPLTVQNLALTTPFTGFPASFVWSNLANINSYEIHILLDGVQIGTYEVFNNSFTYDTMQATADGIDLESFTVEVYGKNTVGLSALPASIFIDNNQTI